MSKPHHRAGWAAGLLALATAFAAAMPTAASSNPGYTVYPAQPGAATYDPAYAAQPNAAATPAPAGDQSGYTAREIVDVGHRFFGDVSQGLASIIEHATARFGLPNGYIIGQEASGAFVGGARFGEGTLYTKTGGYHRVYWQGPSLGLDFGANGDRVMMLVYNLPSIEYLFRRYVGVNGSAYIVAGLGMTVLSRTGVYVVPIVSGVGARLGVNFGYLKFTNQPTWNPF